MGNEWKWWIVNESDNDIVTFKEYRSFMLSGNPFAKGQYDIKSYLTSQSKAFREGVNLPSKMSFTDILKITWNNPDSRKMLYDISTFALLVLKDGSGEYIPTDDDDNVYFVWNSKLFDEYETNFSNQIH